MSDPLDFVTYACRRGHPNNCTAPLACRCSCHQATAVTDLSCPPARSVTGAVLQNHGVEMGLAIPTPSHTD